MSRLEDLVRIASKSKKPLAWYGLAMEYRSAGDVDNALATFKKAHEIDAAYVPAYFMCAQMLAELGRTEDARAEVQRGLQVAREVGDTHALGEMSQLLETLE
ncbi:MAG: tetratricopeptide repeat protein [Deltaproteobacteria bacterium]|nr:tetratricopeptide repeat protein [Deltaproteobacteria bacterium]